MYPPGRALKCYIILTLSVFSIKSVQHHSLQQKIKYQMIPEECAMERVFLPLSVYVTSFGDIPLLSPTAKIKPVENVCLKVHGLS